MITSELALTLHAAVELKMKPQDLMKALKLIETEFENVNFADQPVDIIAAYIHHIYLSAPGPMRSTLMKIICELELSSPNSIVEQYDLDKLIALSIDQRPGESMQSKVDEEKVAAFRCVSILMRFRKYLPTSILRAMISLYNVPNHNYKGLILAYLLEAVLTNSKIEEIPEISSILVSAFHETGNKGVGALIAYASEHKLPFVLMDRFASRLINPISQYIPTKPEDLEVCTKAISALLRTWPTMLLFGFQNNLLKDIVYCLGHQTEAVILILKDILNLTDQRCITDGFTGLVLYALMKCGMIERLNELASTVPEAASFLSELLPFVSQSDTKLIDLSTSSITVQSNQNNTDIVLKIRKHAQSTESSENVTSIANFKLDDDPSKWDWPNINKILSVILPHNETEANLAFTNKKLNSIVDQLAGPMYNTPLDSNQNRTLNMIDTLHSFLILLDTNKKLWENFEKNQNLKKAFEKTLTLFQTSEVIPAKCVCATFFEMIAAMICDPTATNTLKKMDLADKLVTFGSTVTTPQNIKLCLSLIKIEKDTLSIDVFRSFLNSQVPTAQQIAIEAIREKKKSAKNFVDAVFKALIIPHVKQIQDPEQMNAAMNLLSELCLDDMECRRAAAEDMQLLDVIATKNHLMLAIFFSIESVIKKLNTQKEITYWMEKGNAKYCKLYDAAFEACYGDTSALASFPSVTLVNGFARIPPHIFGELAKTAEGLAVVEPQVGQLLNLIKAKKKHEIRAALFALAHICSSPLAENLVKDNDIGEAIFNVMNSTDSSLIRGTCVVAFSMFSPSSYISTLISKHDWQFFNFGSRSCVIPINFEQFVGKPDVCEPTMAQVEVIKGEEDKCQLLKRLTSMISFNKAKEEIKSIFKNDQSSFRKSILAKYGHELMATYSVSPDARFFIEVLFKDTPMVGIPKDVKLDRKLEAQCAGKLLEAIVAKPNLLSYNEVQIQECDIDKCKKMGRMMYCDMFLNDDNFKSVAGMTKEQFYALPEPDYSNKRLSWSEANSN